MNNLNPGDRVNLFTSQAPDLVAIGIRGRRITLMHQIVEQPSGDHDALVLYLRLERCCGRQMIKPSASRRYFNDNVLSFIIGICGIGY